MRLTGACVPVSLAAMTCGFVSIPMMRESSPSFVVVLLEVDKNTGSEDKKYQAMNKMNDQLVLGPK